MKHFINILSPFDDFWSIPSNTRIGFFDTDKYELVPRKEYASEVLKDIEGRIEEENKRHNSAMERLTKERDMVRKIIEG